MRRFAGLEQAAENAIQLDVVSGSGVVYEIGVAPQNANRFYRVERPERSPRRLAQLAPLATRLTPFPPLRRATLLNSARVCSSVSIKADHHRSCISPRAKARSAAGPCWIAVGISAAFFLHRPLGVLHYELEHQCFFYKRKCPLGPGAVSPTNDLPLAIASAVTTSGQFVIVYQESS